MAEKGGSIIDSPELALSTRNQFIDAEYKSAGENVFIKIE